MNLTDPVLEPLAVWAILSPLAVVPLYFLAEAWDRRKRRKRRD